MRSDNDGYYPYAIGGKTGSTNQAGACLIAMASNDGMNLISLIFKDDSKDGRNRWPIAKSMFDYGFNNYITIDIQSLLDKATPVQVQIENYASSDQSDGLLEFEGPQSAGTLATIDKAAAEGILNGTDTIESETTYTHALQAPVLKGDVLGTVTYKSTATGDIIYQGSLIATRDVLQAGTEPDASGATAVTVVPPINIEELKPNDSIYYWLLIPVALIVFLVVRLLTVTRRKRKRFKNRRPHYSYRIR
jgi:D-alanyl-D-alanine carboxypeptidase